ncbi:MAG: portal protein [Archangium sp.]
MADDMMDLETNARGGREGPLTKRQNARLEEKRKKVQRLRVRHAALRDEASTWRDEWEQISEQMRPRGFRRSRADANRADRSKQREIINFTPVEARRTLASGMMTGITSPSRPWFRLIESDPEISEDPEVKDWLVKVTRALLNLLARSNVYKGLHGLYDDIGTYGTAAMHVELDTEDGARAYNFTVGTYVLAASERGNVDTIFRECSLTVEQLVTKFGRENCSRSTQKLYDDGQLDKRVDVTHAIYPNRGYVEGRFGQEGKQWCSDWWEDSSGSADDAAFLRESGYDRFPVLCPRWVRNHEDVYGTGPGHDALGDSKALQLDERRKAQAVDKIVAPPMAAPFSAAGTPISLLPGETTFLDGLGGGGQALRPAIDVNPNVVTVAENASRQKEDRIRRAFFAHLWLLITEQTGNMTATEVDQRREEKLQQLGAVLEGLNDEALDPLIDLLFDICVALGDVPQSPEVLEGRDVRPEYISVMAAAQKLLATTGLERVAAFVMGIAKMDPNVMDKVDWEKLIEEYADAVGVPPAVLKTEEAVKAIRTAKAKIQAQAAQMQVLQQGADTAKTLADTNVEQPSALNEMLRGAGVR